jgi:peptidyl-tRNA hydrolase, PTH1 family
MKYLIIGLGNVGNEYAHTRHNIGFDVLDALVKGTDASFSLDRHAHVAQLKHKGRTLVLVKPTTYMNLSGKAVKYWMQAKKIELENVLVIVDDLALPVGAIRIRTKGSDAGHNGLKDIQASLNTNEYTRVRFGIGNDYAKGQQADFVLSKFKPDEQTIINEKINVCVDVIKSFCTAGINNTMNAFNNK